MSPDEAAIVLSHLVCGARFECFEQGGGVSLVGAPATDGRLEWVWSQTLVSTTNHFERETETRRFDDAALRAFLSETPLDFRWLMRGLVRPG